MKKTSRIWLIVLGSFLLIVAVLGVLAYHTVRQISSGDIFSDGFIRDQIVRHLSEEERVFFDALPTALGFSEPHTYLILFQNNTELRPGGGFIGVYAVVRVNRGQVEIVRVEGTEILDRGAPDDWVVQPPAPLSDHLGVDRWYFRDSNWSPDFSVSAQRAIEFYAAEGGIAADEVDAVIGITPTVLEELLRLTGPVTVDGITFEPDTVTETLEYDVEYGFKDRGLSVAQRKAIIAPLFRAVIDRLSVGLFSKHETYARVLTTLVNEKHVLGYSSNTDLNDVIHDIGAAGAISQDQNDYLLWVDANLAALKTDHAIDRSLAYTIEPQEDDTYLARAAMTYDHNGTFDWRTTRYRTYARVFVPVGAELKAVIGDDGEIDQGVELGKQWFGAFKSIEPGQTETLEFIYTLPESVGATIRDGQYNLEVQKQPGTIVPGLTLTLDFGTMIAAATPAEDESLWGDSTYMIETDLRVDRTFGVLFDTEDSTNTF